MYLLHTLIRNPAPKISRLSCPKGTEPMLRHQSTILVVDDDPIAIATLNALLHRSYHLVFACNGVDALAVAATCTPDLVLLDVMMPLMDGFEVCRALRSDARLAEVPIMMITALDDRESRLQGIEAGADDFISKPFDFVELQARARTITCLNRYRRLMNERAKYELLVNQSPNGIALVGSDQAVTLANPALLDLLGLPLEEVVGCGLATFIAGPHVSLCAEVLERAAQAGEPVAELMVRHSSGRYIPVEVRGRRFVDGDEPSVLVIVRDITEHKRAELALEAERRRVAYDLHDGLAQVSVSAYHHLQAYAARHCPRSTEGRAALEAALTQLHSVVQETRRMITGLRPTELDDFGLARALRVQVDALSAVGWEITFTEPQPAIHLPPAIETALFWVAKEAITNIRKHAGTTSVAVDLSYTPDLIQLSIRDRGCGFDMRTAYIGAEPGQRIGLHSMQERIAVIGGRCTIWSAPGQGTHVVTEVPLPPHNRESIPR
jgi:PAS domain S-box-containing protein